MSGVTGEWWVCLCDSLGNVKHQQIKDFLKENHKLVVIGAAREKLPVALGATMDDSAAAGRILKREIRKMWEAEKEGGCDGDS